MREKAATILFVIILSFVGVVSFHVFNRLFIEADSTFIYTGASAFLGAFFAFIFVRIGDLFKSYSDRISKNHNSLVKLEYLLNTTIGTLDGNIHAIESFEEIYALTKNGIEQSQVFVWVSRLHPVTLYDDLLLDLTNIDLVNELFILNLRLRNLNESMETINGTYVESKDALTSQKSTPDNYLNNLKRIHDNLLDIKKILSSTLDETMEALSAIRVLATVRPLLGYVVRKLGVHKYGRKFKDQRASEMTKLRKEMEQIKNASQQRLDSILKKQADNTRT